MTATVAFAVAFAVAVAGGSGSDERTTLGAICGNTGDVSTVDGARGSAEPAVARLESAVPAVARLELAVPVFAEPELAEPELAVLASRSLYAPMPTPIKTTPNAASKTLGFIPLRTATGFPVAMPTTDADAWLSPKGWGV